MEVLNDVWTIGELKKKSYPIIYKLKRDFVIKLVRHEWDKRRLVWKRYEYRKLYNLIPIHAISSICI